MESVVGREPEIRILNDAMQSTDAELIAVYGRRRVGKTFLVRQVLGSRFLMEITGLHNGTLQQQLENFSLVLRKYFPDVVLPLIFQSWLQAFDALTACIAPQINKKKMVIFFDELPWMHTRKSGFLPAFENFWNSWACRQKNIAVVICGSAASWMLDRIVRNKGGLHNRITRRIRLLPFTLQETEKYLKSRGVKLDRFQVLQLYMVMGGIPQYLKEIQPGRSSIQNIDRICFSKDGLLKTEFDDLFHALFEKAGRHIDIVKVLANKPTGLMRNEIIRQATLKTGGTATQLLTELEESGFITSTIPYDKKNKDSVYRLSDEYSLFYIKFILPNRKETGKGTWNRLVESASWKSWSGYAFESICLKHVGSVKRALGIEGVYTVTSAWYRRGTKLTDGAQIDLLIDRSDRCINICEMKFSGEIFEITKAYATNLEKKVSVFRREVNPKKTLFLTMITTYGVKENAYKTNLVENELTMDALFE
ncbi:MAG: ATP-binding protein [Chitinophagaceae bacterium]|nr:ATP-binding protein [Chitinophagaceae bacterium]